MPLVTSRGDSHRSTASHNVVYGKRYARADNRGGRTRDKAADGKRAACAADQLRRADVVEADFLVILATVIFSEWLSAAIRQSLI